VPLPDLPFETDAADAAVHAGQRLDGGRAWLDMALAALSMFTIFATAYSFGTFVRPMADEFHAGRGATAFVFAITAFLYFSLGAITGPLVQRVGPRRIIFFGTTVQVIGMLLTARAHALWQAYLTYGIGVGIGVACGYVPMVAVVGGWFTTRRATAIGIAVSGIGLSSLIGAPVAARLIRSIGWRDAYTVFALATAVLMTIVALGVRTPPSFATPPKIALSAALRTRTFIFLYIGLALAAVTLFNVFVNIVPYAEDNGITKVKASTLLSILGGASILGRNALAALAKRVGSLATYSSAIVTMGITQVLWLIAGKSYVVLAVFMALFGVAYGGLIALGPTVLADIFGPEQLGGLAGVNYSAAGLGALTGPTLCAWLVDRTGGYSTGSVLGLVLALIGAALTWSVRPRSGASAR
jgi:predicted MFS family arabinose efflux permease